MQKKNILIIISVVGILIGGAFLFFYSGERGAEKVPEQNATLPEKSGKAGQNEIDISKEAIAGWKICRNEEYGYEFKYPKGWYMYEVFVKYEVLEYKKTSVCKGQFVTLSPEENLTTLYFQDHPSGIEVRMHFNNENSSPKEYLREFYTDNLSQRLTILKEKSINEAKIIWYDFYGFTEVMFSNKGNIFNLRVIPLDQPDFLDAILSTFKFID